VTEPLPSIQAAEVRIERPPDYGKGLHSPALSGNAAISRVVLTVSSADPQGISIFNGKLWVDGEPFLIKGVDYAPWLQGTGPEPYHQPFPSEFDDVTALVTENQRRRVPDNSGDGRIQAWEVMRYDVEVWPRRASTPSALTRAAAGTTATSTASRKPARPHRATFPTGLTTDCCSMPRTSA